MPDPSKLGSRDREMQFDHGHPKHGQRGSSDYDDVPHAGHRGDWDRSPPLNKELGDSQSSELFKLGSPELYGLIGAVTVLIIVLVCMIYYFLCKRNAISMERNRRAKVRPISRRMVRKNTKPKAPMDPETPPPTDEVTVGQQHGAYAEIAIDPIKSSNNQGTCPAGQPPKYEDCNREVNYADIDVR